MANIERILDIQWFSWWESDDIYRWPKDCFYQAENIDVRKNLSWVKLANWLTDTWWVIDGTITYMCNLEDFWLSWILICTDTWNVYKNWTLKFTLNTWNNGHNRVYWVGSLYVSWIQYLYFISGTTNFSLTEALWKIHKVNIDITLNTHSYRDYNSYYGTKSHGSIFVIDNWSNFLFWKWNRIIEFSKNEIVINKISLKEKTEIVWFTQFQNNYKIYSNIWENIWRQDIWNGSDTSVNSTQFWNNQPILWIVNDWAIDYAILWYNEYYSDLYLISWTQKQELRVNLEASNNSRRLNSYLSIREWIVYISWWYSWESNSPWVYTYWNYYPWTLKSLVQEYWTWTSQFMMHCHSTISTYFACANSKVYINYYNNPPYNWWYSTNWYVVSNLYEWNLWKKKL